MNWKSKPLPESLRSLKPEEIQQSAIVLAMVEARNRREALELCPEVMTALLSRRPSELPEHMVGAIIQGHYLEAEIQRRQPEVMKTLTDAGYSQEDALAFFQDELYRQKWATIAEAMREAGR